jgi:hypothetical protein
MRTFLTRGLAFILLCGIIQSVTFGSAHCHLDAFSVRDGGQSAGLATLDEYAVPDPLHLQTQRQECLVCLFHQHLFNSVVQSHFCIANQDRSLSGLRACKFLHYSISFTSKPTFRLSGRAPPRF